MSGRREGEERMMGGTRIAGIAADLRHGLRALRRGGGHTAIGALTLAVGIGAAAAIFAVVDGVLLRPLPYRGAGHRGGELVAVWEDHSGRDGLPRFSLTPPTFRDLRREADGFERLAAYLPGGARMETGAGGAPRQLWISGVSGSAPRRWAAGGPGGRAGPPSGGLDAPLRGLGGRPGEPWGSRRRPPPGGRPGELDPRAADRRGGSGQDSPGRVSRVEAPGSARRAGPVTDEGTSQAEELPRAGARREWGEGGDR